MADHYADGVMCAPHRFDPASIGVFRVLGRTFDVDAGAISLHYELGEQVAFTETLTFETPFSERPDLDAPGLQRALLHLQVAAGTSYYKAVAPRDVIIENEGLSSDELEFHHHLYDDGLREFAVANGLAVPRPVVLQSEGGPEPDRAAARATSGPGGLIVPIGGGKDSMVLIEAVKHLRPRLFAVNPHPLVLDLAHRTGLELVVVRRRLDPELAALNATGALNGHVPITAIISLIAVVGSFLYGYDSIAMAVERSASEETVFVDGVPVNHQYSKSLEFEVLFRSLVAGWIDPGLRYGSALRPYSELAIARTFARLTDYHGTFCSCNSAFRQAAATGDRWCGHCPKCRFVALMLAPFMERGDVAAILGRDLFADPEQTPGFAALMSSDDKPFECVGERRESAAALRILSSRAGWREAPVVSALADRARSLVDDDGVAGLLAPSAELSGPDAGVAAAVRQLMTEVL